MIKDRPHRTQNPVRFNVFKLFLKVVYVCIFRDSSGIAFHNFDAAYLHDPLKLKVLILLLEGPVLVVPLRL